MAALHYGPFYSEHGWGDFCTRPFTVSLTWECTTWEARRLPFLEYLLGPHSPWAGRHSTILPPHLTRSTWVGAFCLDCHFHLMQVFSAWDVWRPGFLEFYCNSTAGGTCLVTCSATVTCRVLHRCRLPPPPPRLTWVESSPMRCQFTTCRACHLPPG